jgi:hypothetical protein
MRGLTGGATTPVAAMPVEAFVEAARLANIWVGVATVAITGLIARRVSGPAAGLLAAGIVAVAPLAVDVTVLARNDPGMVLAVAASTLAALMYYDSQHRGWIYVAAVLAGVAGAIKYSAVFAIVPVMIALVTRPPAEGRLRTFVLTCTAFVLTVGVTNHFMWSDFPNFLRQLSDQVAITGRGHWNATDNPARVYLATLVSLGGGWPVVVLAAAFAAYALSTRDPRLWMVVAFPVLYIWFMTQRPSQFVRWVYPMLPYVAVCAAAALVVLGRTLQTRLASRASGWSRWARPAIATMVVAVLWQPAWKGAVGLSRRLEQPTHVQAETWLREHASAESRVLAGRGWLDLNEAPFVARRVDNLRSTLDQGIEQLAGCNYVIVPEPLFGHPTLRHLSLAERFHADYSFGGNVGMDYEVYSVPALPVEGTCGAGKRSH